MDHVLEKTGRKMKKSINNTMRREEQNNFRAEIHLQEGR